MEMTDMACAHNSRASDSAAWLRRGLRKIWQGLRDWSGDAAYERYLRSGTTRMSSSHTFTAAEFYIEELNRRYSRPHRCC
jgi:uncharacterized short protein YbdD (DUF466 family)